jgi:hypothetical protein
VPGEDPFLSGEYANYYVTGCQQGPDPRYLKMSAGLKHYTAYSVENNRGGWHGVAGAWRGRGGGVAEAWRGRGGGVAGRGGAWRGVAGRGGAWRAVAPGTASRHALKPHLCVL